MPLDRTNQDGFRGNSSAMRPLIHHAPRRSTRSHISSPGSRDTARPASRVSELLRGRRGHNAPAPPLRARKMAAPRPSLRREARAEVAAEVALRRRAEVLAGSGAGRVQVSGARGRPAHWAVAAPWASGPLLGPVFASAAPRPRRTDVPTAPNAGCCGVPL